MAICVAGAFDPTVQASYAAGASTSPTLLESRDALMRGGASWFLGGGSPPRASQNAISAARHMLPEVDMACRQSPSEVGAFYGKSTSELTEDR